VDAATGGAGHNVLICCVFVGKGGESVFLVYRGAALHAERDWSWFWRYAWLPCLLWFFCTTSFHVTGH